MQIFCCHSKVKNKKGLDLSRKNDGSGLLQKPSMLMPVTPTTKVNILPSLLIKYESICVHSTFFTDYRRHQELSTSSIP